MSNKIISARADITNFSLENKVCFLVIIVLHLEQKTAGLLPFMKLALCIPSWHSNDLLI